jgi:DNA-binding GntR family transcriptional regulator
MGDVSNTLTIDKSSLDVRAAAAIRQQIVAGMLVPGTRLTEMRLAGDLALSRGTIRAALHQLVGEGLVEQVPYTGWAVTRLGPRDLWELYTLRGSLEGLAARLVAESIDDERAARLAQIFDDLVGACQAGNPLLVAECDFALHLTIVALAGHRRLSRQFALVEGQIRMFIASSNALLPTQRDVIAQHAPLVETIGRGDADAAERVMREHIDSEGRVLIERASGQTGERAMS